jgi:magnesium chelatase subunit D
MAASARMAAAKGAALNLLRDAYVKRNRVALIAFRDDSAEVLLHPTDNVDLAHEQLKILPTGGRTPLGHGLAKALELARQIRQSNADTQLMTVLISDGKANVPYGSSAQTTPFEEAVDFARQLVLLDTDFIVLDTEDDFLSLGLAGKLAAAVGAEYLKLSRVEEGVIESAVREQLQQENSIRK